MQTMLILRPFKPTDLEKVMHINRVCLPENYTSFFFMDLHEHFPATFLVAEKNDAIVGYVMCRVETGLSNYGILGISKKGHVISIAVLPEHRRQGIAHALMLEAMKNMLTYKAKECYLEVRISNTPAISLYKKMGFETIRTIHGYYSNGESAHVMSRKLPFEPLLEK
ncbi:MAG: putative N-acetyltransferase [Candidatus Bathyarchaeota archaeon BA1]|nr:MAG: putative N-acetyltransferase [Candidatus Bathyarchaeota archaeon BA1]